MINGCIYLAFSTLWSCFAVLFFEHNLLRTGLFIGFNICTVIHNLLRYHAGFPRWHDLNTLPDPQAGDILEFRKAYGFYSHFGIADGNGGIYHYSSPPGRHSKKSKVRWRYDSIGDVCSSGGHARINNSADKMMNPLEGKEIVMRCKRELVPGSKSHYITFYGTTVNTLPIR